MDRNEDRERQERLAKLPAHESDADVATEAGGGVLQEGGTAVRRGTGDRTGTAQGAEAGTSERAGGDTSAAEQALVPGAGAIADPWRQSDETGLVRTPGTERGAGGGNEPG